MLVGYSPCCGAARNIGQSHRKLLRGIAHSLEETKVRANHARQSRYVVGEAIFTRGARDDPCDRNVMNVAYVGKEVVSRVGIGATRQELRQSAIGAPVERGDHSMDRPVMIDAPVCAHLGKFCFLGEMRSDEQIDEETRGDEAHDECACENLPPGQREHPQGHQKHDQYIDKLASGKACVGADRVADVDKVGQAPLEQVLEVLNEDRVDIDEPKDYRRIKVLEAMIPAPTMIWRQAQEHVAVDVDVAAVDVREDMVRFHVAQTPQIQALLR